ncbi:uncharacterized protein EHS24_007699 [Apiotrichum porosum]|uniref:AAA+ ATPase domain-containing protein n=1 Tax=Apiotrichum porosum TaxID=105984 RepID=A0A427XVE9_9TREE|nr:uncharacterized protein EHS24_007699 [Apiotrichum porosum]RSH82705.1 hypothetical protein EHS24_007699 [Apiotrichum porosum]
MPTRILEAPAPPRPQKRRSLMADSEEDIDMLTPADMTFTPVAPSSLLPDEEDDHDVDEDDEEDNLFTAHSNAQESYLDENENEPSVTATSHRRVVAFADENQDDNVEYADENTHVGGAFGHSDEVDADLGDDTLHSDLELEAEEDDELESSDDEDDEDDVDVVHVEVRLRPEATLLPSIIEANIPPFLRNNYRWLSGGTLVAPEGWADVGVLGRSVEQIYIAECGDGHPVDAQEATYHVHVYKTVDNYVELSGGLDEDEEEQEANTSAASVRDLPARELEGLWDNLIYDDDIKPRLLTYIHSSMLFSENEVDFNVIAWNRLVLLHGPPGTGKTSLCRALAHKLAIRMGDKYTSGRLVEINSHSLFSKWFSESGKLVQKLFDNVTAMVEDEACFVVVMIDEVESLTSARAAVGEPSDALRSVNALLTQLDKLKQHKNVLVMTTSNLAGSIDPAFVDRADVKQYVGLPPAQAIYWILAGCLRELARSGLCPGGEKLLEWDELARSTRSVASKRGERARIASLQLANTARQAKDQELSGRFLRKVPLMAHARYLASNRTPRVDKWVEAIARSVKDEGESRDRIAAAEGTARRVAAAK